MIKKAEALEFIAEVVREHYDVGEVQTPVPLTATHQRRHRKLSVQTSAGKFLIKTYRNDPVILDALRFQHRLSGHLDGQGLPVASIQSARNGKCIVQLDTWAMELQQFIEAGQMRVNTKTLVHSSKALGRFHKVCEGFPVPPRDARMWRFSEVPRATFQKLFEAAKLEREEALLVDQCNTIALFLQEASRALSWENRSLFETGLIHGDWHGGNLMFRGENLVAIVDLEFAGAGCYLEDVAYALSNLCIRTTMSAQKMLTRSNLLLDCYQCSRSLSYFELVALYYAVGIKHITTVTYQSPQADNKLAGHTAAEWMERLAVQCAWLAEQAEKVRWGR